MKDKLSENIRAFRKERRLTQEQLAEALNVSIGVISKWELGLSAPDVSMILELADFFETSVDVLLGYHMQSKSKDQFIKRLKSYIHDKNAVVSFDEVEKSLKKYPHDFSVVYHSAELYELKGTGSETTKYHLRALELYKKACELFSQNSDPEISIASIRLHMAQIYCSLGKKDEAVDLLKNNNPCGVHHALLGEILADMGKPDDAVMHLSLAMLRNSFMQFDIAIGYINVYMSEANYHGVIDVVRWIEASAQAVKTSDKINYLDKLLSGLIAVGAFARLCLGNTDSAKAELCRARDIALQFDAAPTYDATCIRFVVVDAATGYDDLGATAMDGLEQTVKEQNSPGFSAIWEEIKHEESNNQTAEELYC